jgi:phosphoribosylanthranilate isomerase
VLAGGLLPSNVDGAIKLVRPFAVDASSGIERTPGIKDPRLMRAFFGVVAGADISGGSVT